MRVGWPLCRRRRRSSHPRQSRRRRGRGVHRAAAAASYSSSCSENRGETTCTWRVLASASSVRFFFLSSLFFFRSCSEAAAAEAAAASAANVEHVADRADNDVDRPQSAAAAATTTSTNERSPFHNRIGLKRTSPIRAPSRKRRGLSAQVSITDGSASPDGGDEGCSSGSRANRRYGNEQEDGTT